MINSNLNDLLAENHTTAHTEDHELSRCYAPINQFDAHEPFLPLASDNRRIFAYLKSLAFIPVMQLSQLFETLSKCLVPFIAIRLDSISYRVVEIRSGTTPHFALKQLFSGKL